MDISFGKSTLDTSIHVMYSPANREAMALAYPLISSILARIAVLPASSAQVERLFSAMKSLYKEIVLNQQLTIIS